MEAIFRQRHLSVLFAACVGLAGIPSGGSASTQDESVFVDGLKRCLEFYSTKSEAVFDDWLVERPYNRSCDSCSTSSGSVRSETAEMTVHFEHTDVGRFHGMSCFSEFGTGPSASDALLLEVNAWIGEKIDDATVIEIPEKARRYPSEMLQICQSDQPSAGISIGIRRDNEMWFHVSSGENTGTDKRPLPVCHTIGGDDA